MTTQPFAPKDAETLKTEITEEMGIEYEGNEELVDKLVARELKDEEFKASLHSEKNKHKDEKDAYKQKMLKAGLDPETGEKLPSKDAGTEKETPKNIGLSAKDAVALRDVHEEDVEFLITEASLREKSISEMKKDPYMQIILKTRAEERKSAEISSTAPTKRGNSKISSDALIKRAESGDETMSTEEIKEAASLAIENAYKSR